MTIILRLILALLMLTAPVSAWAQARACRLPAVVPVPHPDGPTADQPRRVLPIGSYTLALSWSPERCRRASAADAFQCRARPRFGFVLHGLWPDGVGKDWPQYCAPAAILPARTIRANLCATPSAQLLQHEWAKHGTCMAGETPDSYFAKAARLYRAIRAPDMNRLSRRPLTVAGFTRAFAAANPGLTPAMMRVTVTRRGWLDEVWLCHDRALRPAVCPAHQGGAAPETRLRIWRGGSARRA